VVAAPTPAGASSADFTAVSALASNNGWAVGRSTTLNSSGVVSSPLVEHFNGTSWSIQTTPATAGSLNAVTAISPTDVWAVGGTGSVSGWHNPGVSGSCREIWRALGRLASKCGEAIMASLSRRRLSLCIPKSAC
jgi:hypothetical protein